MNQTRATLADLPPPPAGRGGWPWAAETPPLPAGPPWPRITVVTPSFNQAQFLEEAIRSVLLQGYPNLEYMVLDGGSQDGSAELIARYAPWLSHWQSQPDGGQSAALAAGFARSSGEILAWINSDDRLRPGALARVARFFMARPRLAFASGDVNLIDVAGRTTQRVFAVKPMPTVTANLGVHTWPQQGCFWRRGAYERAGGVDAGLRFCMDRDLFIRLARGGPSARLPGPPLGDFRLHEEAKTARWAEIQRREQQLIAERYGSRWRGNPLFQRALGLRWRLARLGKGLRSRAVGLGLEL